MPSGQNLCTCTLRGPAGTRERDTDGCDNGYVHRRQHTEFLSPLIDDEMSSRENSMLVKRLKAADFSIQKTFEQFDFKFNEEALPAKILRDLAT